jgi:hypothetical protein
MIIQDMSLTGAPMAFARQQNSDTVNAFTQTTNSASAVSCSLESTFE